MTTQELSAMTVVELRKLAKENGVKLGAGVSKSDIVAKLAAALCDAQPAAEPVPAPAPAAASGEDGALVAAITAAVAAYIDSDPALASQFASGFRVVSFKPTSKNRNR